MMKDINIDFGAITIDNSILKSEGYKFYEGLLAQMSQFKKSPVQVIQPDIIHNEAIKHIEKEIYNARSSIHQAIRSANKQLNINKSDLSRAEELLSVVGTDKEIATKKLNEYYEFIGAEKIDSSEYVELSDLMDLYFNTHAPFENGKNKKNEFPDAIALLSIDSWGDAHDLNVIAVSQDMGWKEFSGGCYRIKVVSSLAEALEIFQPHNKVSSIIYKIREDSLFADKNHILEQIKVKIIDSLDSADIYIEANSSMFLEWDDVFASYISHKLDNDINGSVSVNVVRIDDGLIVLKLGATVKVEVAARFYFSSKDPVDRGYVRLRGYVCKTTESFHTDILLTLSGDFSKDFEEIEVDEIEVVETINEAHFLEVELEWPDEYD
ncbi:DUF4935 domain-containing protein [Serratia symbiotica]|uniref:PIN domain-containing protein n=2 Tax=Serratia symbiotica TaxID=138074 RepID=UPI00188867E4|nr:PIN domain-containing protein [Serratia symbiotica]MBF1996651.1 DUF4935 domain-containing protein [Serratia symbiotica]